MFERNRTYSVARMVKAGAMALNAVVPSIPKSAKDWELLERMGRPMEGTQNGGGQTDERMGA